MGESGYKKICLRKLVNWSCLFVMSYNFDKICMVRFIVKCRSSERVERDETPS
jgi:hypothetical protein